MELEHGYFTMNFTHLNYIHVTFNRIFFFYGVFNTFTF